jgi:2-phospho-L-lactate guanylyltransferase
MRDIRAVVPVKRFSEAKQRLAAHVSPDFRIGLARAMLDDVLGCLRQVPELSGVLVVTGDEEAAALARAHDAEILSEPVPGGHNAAVNHAARHIIGQRAEGALVLPGDVPAMTPAEVSALLRGHPPGRALSIVPARDQDGSNAILATPPDLFAFRYGPGSFLRHVAAARANGVAPAVHHLPGIALDIDEMDDLLTFAPRQRGSSTSWLLSTHRDFALYRGPIS